MARKPRSSAPPAARTGHRVTFQITTFRPLPIGQQVFIAGNHEALGDWAADGFPLTRLDDNLWAGSLVLPRAVDLEFKITRGAWTSEETDEQRAPRREHHRLPAGGPAIFAHTVYGWTDRA